MNENINDTVLNEATYGNGNKIATSKIQNDQILEPRKAPLLLNIGLKNLRPFLKKDNSKELCAVVNKNLQQIPNHGILEKSLLRQETKLSLDKTLPKQMNTSQIRNNEISEMFPDTIALKYAREQSAKQISTTKHDSSGQVKDRISLYRMEGRIQESSKKLVEGEKTYILNQFNSAKKTYRTIAKRVINDEEHLFTSDAITRLIGERNYQIVLAAILNNNQDTKTRAICALLRERAPSKDVSTQTEQASALEQELPNILNPRHSNVCLKKVPQQLQRRRNMRRKTPYVVKDPPKNNSPSSEIKNSLNEHELRDSIDKTVQNSHEFNILDCDEDVPGCDTLIEKASMCSKMSFSVTPSLDYALNFKNLKPVLEKLTPNSPKPVIGQHLNVDTFGKKLQVNIGTHQESCNSHHENQNSKVLPKLQTQTIINPPKSKTENSENTSLDSPNRVGNALIMDNNAQVMWSSTMNVKSLASKTNNTPSPQSDIQIAPSISTNILNDGPKATCSNMPREISGLDDPEFLSKLKSEDPLNLVTSELMNILSDEDKAKLVNLQMEMDWRLCVETIDERYLPIHIAVLQDNLPLLKRQCMALRARNESVDMGDVEHNLSALHIAVMQASDLECVKILLDHFANPLERDDDDKTVLHHCTKLESEVHLNYIVSHMLRNADQILQRADLWNDNLKNMDWDELGRYLLNYANEMDDISGFTPTMEMSRLGLHAHILTLLEQMSPKQAEKAVNRRNRTSGNTALHLAVQAACTSNENDKSIIPEEYVRTIDVLLKFGADLNIENYSRISAISMISENEFTSGMCELLNSKLTEHRMRENSSGIENDDDNIMDVPYKSSLNDNLPIISSKVLDDSQSCVIDKETAVSEDIVIKDNQKNNFQVENEPIIMTLTSNENTQTKEQVGVLRTFMNVSNLKTDVRQFDLAASPETERPPSITMKRLVKVDPLLVSKKRQNKILEWRHIDTMLNDNNIKILPNTRTTNTTGNINKVHILSQNNDGVHEDENEAMQPTIPEKKCVEKITLLPSMNKTIQILSNIEIPKSLVNKKLLKGNLSTPNIIRRKIQPVESENKSFHDIPVALSCNKSIKKLSSIDMPKTLIEKKIINVSSSHLERKNSKSIMSKNQIIGNEYNFSRNNKDFDIKQSMSNIEIPKTLIEENIRESISSLHSKTEKYDSIMSENTINVNALLPNDKDIENKQKTSKIEKPKNLIENKNEDDTLLSRPKIFFFKSNMLKNTMIGNGYKLSQNSCDVEIPENKIMSKIEMPKTFIEKKTHLSNEDHVSSLQRKKNNLKSIILENTIIGNVDKSLPSNKDIEKSVKQIISRIEIPKSLIERKIKDNILSSHVEISEKQIVSKLEIPRKFAKNNNEDDMKSSRLTKEKSKSIFSENKSVDAISFSGDEYIEVPRTPISKVKDILSLESQKKKLNLIRETKKVNHMSKWNSEIRTHDSTEDTIDTLTHSSWNDDERVDNIDKVPMKNTISGGKSILSADVMKVVFGSSTEKIPSYSIATSKITNSSNSKDKSIPPKQTTKILPSEMIKEIYCTSLCDLKVQMLNVATSEHMSSTIDTIKIDRNDILKLKIDKAEAVKGNINVSNSFMDENATSKSVGIKTCKNHVETLITKGMINKVNGSSSIIAEEEWWSRKLAQKNLEKYDVAEQVSQMDPLPCYEVQHVAKEKFPSAKLSKESIKKVFKQNSFKQVSQMDPLPSDKLHCVVSSEKRVGKKNMTSHHKEDVSLLHVAREKSPSAELSIKIIGKANKQKYTKKRNSKEILQVNETLKASKRRKLEVLSNEKNESIKRNNKIKINIPNKNKFIPISESESDYSMESDDELYKPPSSHLLRRKTCTPSNKKPDKISTRTFASKRIKKTPKRYSPTEHIVKKISTRRYTCIT